METNVRLSPYGIAVENKSGTYVSYNPLKNEIVDVDTFNFDGEQLLYKVPVPISKITIGDVVIHNKIPVIVKEVLEDSLLVIDVYEGELKEIILTRNIFGFNYATKIISLLGNIEANEENPFGDMWMIFAMKDQENLLPLMLCMNDKMDKNMLPWLLMSQDNSNNTLLAMMLMNQNGSFT